MHTINIKRFGLAFGFTGAIIYLGCALLLTIMGKEAAVFFLNTILHGFDTTYLLKSSMPFWEVILGIIETFVLSWFVGTSIASIYNVTLTKKTK